MCFIEPLGVRDNESRLYIQRWRCVAVLCAFLMLLVQMTNDNSKSSTLFIAVLRLFVFFGEVSLIR